MDQTSYLYNEFKINGFDNLGLGSSENIFETSQNEDSLTAQRRRSYLMEMNEDFDIQQVFKDISWNQRITE